MLRIFAIATATFVVCAAATYAVVLFGTLTAWQILGSADGDGGGSMGLAFVIAPIVALICGLAGAIAAALYARRRSSNAPASAEERRRAVNQFALVAGIVAGGFAGRLFSEFVFWLAGPVRYDAMWKAWAHAWAPTIIMLAGAVAGWLIARRLLHS